MKKRNFLYIALFFSNLLHLFIFYHTFFIISANSHLQENLYNFPLLITATSFQRNLHRQSPLNLSKQILLQILPQQPNKSTDMQHFATCSKRKCHRLYISRLPLKHNKMRQRKNQKSIILTFVFPKKTVMRRCEKSLKWSLKIVMM